MNTNIGRNDPCYCGSGKKYKKCHLPLDEQEAAAQARASVQPPPIPVPAQNELSESMVAPVAPRSIPELSGMLQRLAHHGPQKQRAEFQRLLADTGPVLTYVERLEEIEAAAAAIEPYHEEYRKLARNEQAYLEHAERLFAEERFAPLRSRPPRFSAP